MVMNDHEGRVYSQRGEKKSRLPMINYPACERMWEYIPIDIKLISYNFKDEE